jgi:invasion protein IalB
MMQRTTIATALLTGALLATIAASAQQPAPPRPTPPRPATAPRPPAAPAPHAPAPATQEPERTTASYGDWVVRCETHAGPPVQKACEMQQVAMMQGQANPISLIAISVPAKGQPTRLVVQLPVNVSLPTPVRITADNKDHLTVAFHRCVPQGCFADTEIKDEEIKRLRAETQPGKLFYKDAAERDVAIPISFKGFGQAFDALLKQ